MGRLSSGCQVLGLDKTVTGPPTLCCILQSAILLCLAGSRMVYMYAVQSGTEEMGELATSETFQFVMSSHFVIVCFPAIVLVISFPGCLLEKKTKKKTSFSKFNYTCYMCVMNTLTVCCKLSRHLLKECLFMSVWVPLLWTTSSTWLVL